MSFEAWWVLIILLIALLKALSMVFDLVCFKILYVKPFWYFHSKFKARKTLLFLEVSADVHDQNI